MRINWMHLLMWIASGIIFIAFLLGSVGCSGVWHMNKAIDKGVTCGKIDTIRVQKYDTITKTFYYYDSLVIVNDRVVPLTRTEIRYLDRVRHDTLKHNETIIKYITKQEKEKTKQKKSEEKNDTRWVWALALVIIGLLILLFLIDKLKRFIS